MDQSPRVRRVAEDYQCTGTGAPAEGGDVGARAQRRDGGYQPASGGRKDSVRTPGSTDSRGKEVTRWSRWTAVSTSQQLTTGEIPLRIVDIPPYRRVGVNYSACLLYTSPSPRD